MNSRLQMWPLSVTLAMTLTLNFQGQISNRLYLSHEWCDCHETKSIHIDWSQYLKCDHQIWPWPWPWPWIFKVKYEICYISTKSGPIPTKWKANISIWTLGLKYDNGFDLGHDLDIWIFKVICDLDHLVTKVKCKDLPDSDRGDFRCRRAFDSYSYTRWTPSYAVHKYLSPVLSYFGTSALSCHIIDVYSEWQRSIVALGKYQGTRCLRLAFS